MSTNITTRNQVQAFPFIFGPSQENSVDLGYGTMVGTPLDMVPVFENLMGEAMIDHLLLSQFNENLSVILSRELKTGNRIAEVWSGWPHRESIFVILASPFKNRHHDLPEGISYEELNDPHFWKAEYYDSQSRHCLGCRF